MKASELKTGRSFAVTFDHGDDFMPSLAKFCQDSNVRQGYIPMFLAGFAEADIVGTCEKLADPNAPSSTVHRTFRHSQIAEYLLTCAEPIFKPWARRLSSLERACHAAAPRTSRVQGSGGVALHRRAVLAVPCLASEGSGRTCLLGVRRC
jgi:hypothetical protein